MPRVHHVKKARKPIKEIGVKKGDSYYWWKFRHGGKRVSKTMPKPSQLTQSEFLSNMYGHQETFQALSFSGGKDDLESFADEVRSLAEDVRQCGEDCQERRDNMENAFPSGCPTMEMLEERVQQCEQIADELETAADSIAGIDTDEGSGIESDEDLAVEVQGFLDGVSWDFS